jgi:hypothetical protein
MGRLNKRQMVILGLMGLAILYAAFDLMTPRKKPAALDAAKRTAELSTFVSDLTASLGKDTTRNLSALIFSRAEKEWAQDPFLDARAHRGWSAAKAPAKKEGPGAAAVPAPAKSEFTYSGFLDTGRKRMAIVNGIEYSEGENLEIKGYVLKSIAPTKVVIENRNTGAMVTVPLVE